MAHRHGPLMAADGFATLWAYTVRATRQAEFESHYGPGGSWADLFRLAPGYLGTELLRDRADSLRYVTVDRWESAERWGEFRARFAFEYERLDRACEGLTAQETPLGEFAPVAAGRR